MAAGSRRHRPSWADLLPELVGLVLRRLPSLADRVRLGAVCRPWRRAARREPLPPPLPWLTLLDGTFLSVPGGEVHRMPHVPEDATLHGSAGNWLFLERRRLHGGGLALMDPFSNQVERLPDAATYDRFLVECLDDELEPIEILGGKLELELPPTKRIRRDDEPIFLKLLPLSALDPSPDSLFAVLITNRIFHSIISICRRPEATAAITFEMPEYIYDVAFFDGKLYALSSGEKLFALEIVSGDEGKPRLSSWKRVISALNDPETVHLSIGDKTYIGWYRSYLAQSKGKLFQVRRLVGCLSTLAKKDDLGELCNPSI